MASPAESAAATSASQWDMPVGTTMGPAGGIVTLVQSSSFCISEYAGDIAAHTTQGLYFRDRRILSRFELQVNGEHAESLTTTEPDPFHAVFVSRVPSANGADSTLLVLRHRYVGRGMREDLTIRNFGDRPDTCSLELLIEADFAHLYEVKGGRIPPRPTPGAVYDSGTRTLEISRADHLRAVRLTSSHPAQRSEGGLRLEVVVPAKGSWDACIQVSPVIEGQRVTPRYLCGEPVEEGWPTRKLASWRQKIPVVDTDCEGLERLVRHSGEDLAALRLFDPDHPDRVLVAAGSPWFLTLFGRDSILTAWMALIADPDLALGVLQTLARFQGTRVDPRFDEEPGRILHEMRMGGSAALSWDGAEIYYGSVDATPLFVILLGELRRWGLADDEVPELLPHADRALEWIEHYGDRDGDGYVEYQRATDAGLPNQGWKDSRDGIRFADGHLPQTPIALCEVQAYVYGAYVARAHFAAEAGDTATFERFSAKAADLKAAFNRDFWLEDREWFAVGLDRDKRQIDSLASNVGHCLWTGIVDQDKAACVAERLLSPEMFSGWGIRTLAESMGGYNPISYHCGSVWPHDNAIIAAGLMRYDFVEEAHRVVMAMIEAAATQGHRLPELFSGLDRSDLGTVVRYPTSCSPQAWAAASPLLFLRTLLRIDPWAREGKVWLAPTLPPQIERLRVENILLGHSRVTVHVEKGKKTRVEGWPADIELIEEPRKPLTTVLPGSTS